MIVNHDQLLILKTKIKEIYCAKHKKDSMIDVKNIRCQEIDCKSRPSLNFEDQIKEIYCAKHKKDVMINVINKRF